MERFKECLEEIILACDKLSAQWEKVDADYSDRLAEKYPFDTSFDEVILKLKDWKDSL